MTCGEHLAGCKERALRHIDDAGDLQGDVAYMTSDLMKHEGTSDTPRELILRSAALRTASTEPGSKVTGSKTDPPREGIKIGICRVYGDLRGLPAAILPGRRNVVWSGEVAHQGVRECPAG